MKNSSIFQAEMFIIMYAFSVLAAILRLFRCCNDRPNIFNAVQLVIHFAAASRLGHLRSSRQGSRVTFCARIIYEGTPGISVSVVFVLAHDHRRSLPKYRHIFYHQRGWYNILDALEIIITVHNKRYLPALRFITIRLSTYGNLGPLL